MSSTDPFSPPRPRAPKRRLRDRLVVAGLVVLVFAGLAGLAAATGWEETRAQIAKLQLWQLLVLLALSMTNYLFRGLRWHMFSEHLGLPLGYLATFRHFLGGFAMSVTPGRLGELVRMRWIGRETGWKFERTAPLVLVDRASDLAALGVLLGVSLAFSATGIAFGIPVTLLALAGAVVATRPRLL
ncbi:MAG: flippase-like domain-containing protein, partial [Maritimibacter sp.]|nr:flippase-like domain-containing protein [Maritimibacter sp.]